MISNNLGHRLNALVAGYGKNGDLGGNSRKVVVQSEDYVTLSGLALAVHHCQEVDGGKEDLDPRAGKVRIAGDRPGDEFTLEFASFSQKNQLDENGQFRDSERVVARSETKEGQEHYSWSLSMDDSHATMVVLEDKGESFLATAISLFPNETMNSKVVRSGPWDELTGAKRI